MRACGCIERAGGCVREKRESTNSASTAVHGPWRPDIGAAPSWRPGRRPRANPNSPGCATGPWSRLRVRFCTCTGTIATITPHITPHMACASLPAHPLAAATAMNARGAILRGITHVARFKSNQKSKSNQPPRCKRIRSAVDDISVLRGMGLHRPLLGGGRRILQVMGAGAGFFVTVGLLKVLAEATTAHDLSLTLTRTSPDPRPTHSLTTTPPQSESYSRTHLEQFLDVNFRLVILIMPLCGLL